MGALVICLTLSSKETYKNPHRLIVFQIGNLTLN